MAELLFFDCFSFVPAFFCSLKIINHWGLFQGQVLWLGLDHKIASLLTRKPCFVLFLWGPLPYLLIVLIFIFLGTSGIIYLSMCLFHPTYLFLIASFWLLFFTAKFSAFLNIFLSNNNQIEAEKNKRVLLGDLGITMQETEIQVK